MYWFKSILQTTCCGAQYICEFCLWDLLEAQTRRTKRPPSESGPMPRLVQDPQRLLLSSLADVSVDVDCPFCMCVMALQEVCFCVHSRGLVCPEGDTGGIIDEVMPPSLWQYIGSLWKGCPNITSFGKAPR